MGLECLQADKIDHKTGSMRISRNPSASLLNIKDGSVEQNVLGGFYGEDGIRIPPGTCTLHVYTGKDSDGGSCYHVSCISAFGKELEVYSFGK